MLQIFMPLVEVAGAKIWKPEINQSLQHSI